MALILFDVETRIDKALLHQIEYPDSDQSDEALYEHYRQALLHESQGRSSFVPLTYHVPISIGVGVINPDWSLASVETLAYTEPNMPHDPSGPGVPLDLFAPQAPQSFTPDAAWYERAMVERFWALVGTGATLVSFNGRAFDLPVLELAALRYGIQSPRYWNEKYGHRYRFSEDGHIDLYDVLTNTGACQLKGGLNLLMAILGYRGKDGMRGEDVQAAYDAGLLMDVHRYCRRDVICTYLLFLRVQLMRGRLSPAQYEAACAQSAPWLEQIR